MTAIASSAGSDSSRIADDSAASVDIIASLIGCTPQAIAKGLCFRSIKTNEEVVVVPNTKVQACDARDALSKALYGRVFDWIVARINESFTTSASQQKNFIGILDIFGFEFFDVNSFEQLCINYANEMLQNQFNAFVFQLEQIEYGAEGIPWSYIEFFDNKPCLEAIGGKSGSVLACLDEECLVPAGSDGGFCAKVRAIKNKFLKAPPKNQASFTVCHYAGEVEYANTGFLDKNRDALAPDISDMLAASTSSFVADLFPSAKREKRGSVVAGAKRGGGGAGATAGKKGQMSQPTLGAQFQKSLLALMDVIVKTQPHYVRCITPNSHKKAGEINNARVVQQLQCSGVIEAVRVTRAGFPSRFLYDDFVQRYRVISPPACAADSRQSCAALLGAAGLELGAAVQMGKTKLFLKLSAVDLLDKRRAVALGVFATKFNRCVRGWLCRVKVRKWRASVAALSWF
jgi:myosin-5